MPKPIKRKQASEINPFIDHNDSTQTLENVAQTLREFGILISDTKCDKGWMFLITDTLAAALAFEAEQDLALRAADKT